MKLRSLYTTKTIEFYTSNHATKLKLPSEITV